jgi:hypothetical protein
VYVEMGLFPVGESGCKIHTIERQAYLVFPFPTTKTKPVQVSEFSEVSFGGIHGKIHVHICEWSFKVTYRNEPMKKRLADW